MNNPPRNSWLDSLVCGAALLSLVLAMDTVRLFGSQQWLSALIGIESEYFLALFALLFPLAFWVYPRHRWLDTLLSLTSVGLLGVLFFNAETALDEAWEFGAPHWVVWCCLGLWVCLMEALRRAGGTALALIAGFFSILPLITHLLPGPLNGLEASWQDTAAYHWISIESVFGLPFRAFADLVIGFVLFGVVLQHTGGGRFFLDLAFALLGRQRGGPAKVAIFSSGLMGSMSGSVVTNVLTTGQLTIPAMRRSGMAAPVAGGVEACASTGGVLLPPVMGSTAFVMATLLEIPYAQVAAAAAIPALLYFLSLYIQIDAYAGRSGLQGLEEAEIPRIWQTFREGWFYLGAFALLVFLLIFLKRESLAPYYATAALLVVNQFSPTHRLNAAGLLKLGVGTGRLLIELAVILAGVGLIVGALSLTGLSGTLVNDLLSLAGDSLLLLLVMGATASFVLGIGMTVTAAYIFLAVVLAPALVGQGLPALSAHLFILYWAMLSFITPPVALGAFAAASIAESEPLKTGLAAMRLGAVIYIVPFIFVFEPAFILQGEVVDTLWLAGKVLVGIWLLASALQGHLALADKLLGIGVLSMPVRLLMLAAGLLLAAPDLTSVGGPSLLLLSALGSVLALVALVAARVKTPAAVAE